MSAHPRVAPAGIATGIGLLSVFGLSFVFPALATPLAVTAGAAAGLAIAFRDRIPHQSPGFRLGALAVVVASVALVWVSLQPGYIAI